MNFTYLLKNKLKDLLRAPWHFSRGLRSAATLYAARFANRLLPNRFSIDRNRLYPPDKFAPLTSAWVLGAGKSVGATIAEIDPAGTIDNRLPKTIHANIRRQFLMDMQYESPSTFVANIPNGRVWGDGFVITPDDYLLNDVSIDFRSEKTHRSTTSSHWKFQPLQKFDARMAVASTDGGNLYYHWLFQLLPRLQLLKRAGMTWDDVDYVVVNSLRAQFQRDSLDLLGIDRRKVIESSKVPYLRASTLIVPSIPIGNACFSPWMCDFLRSAFISKGADDIKTSSRRLYITRNQAGYRRVLNESDVVDLLRRRGFEVAAMETMTIRQQAATMAACEAIVAPHGGGLSNLVFCSPGTKVVEIFSPELVAAFFWKICNQVGLDYYYLLGKGPPETLETDYPQTWNSRADIEVDLADLGKTLDLANIK